MPPTLQFLPVVDSAELAAARRRELDIDRALAAELGGSAVAAIQRGSYTGPDGAEVDWREAVTAAVASKRTIPPAYGLPQRPGVTFPVTTVQVSNETTLAAASRLTRAGLRPLALNFANGVAPGGGFLTGARAQEEGLCRSSALFATLDGDPMYKAHRPRALPDSTDWAILSPRVPVFRLDDGTPLSAPWLLDFITCAAPYAPKVGAERSAELLAARIERVLAVARATWYDTLVLGAWGCGAFGNDPLRTAQDFRRALEGPYLGAFRHVAFAITDWSAERRFLGPFRDVFA